MTVNVGLRRALMRVDCTSLMRLHDAIFTSEGDPVGDAPLAVYQMSSAH
jgi:hypothetical protein